MSIAICQPFPAARRSEIGAAEKSRRDSPDDRIMRSKRRPGEILNERWSPTSLRIGLGRVRRGDVLPGFAVYYPTSAHRRQAPILGGSAQNAHASRTSTRWNVERIMREIGGLGRSPFLQ